MIRLFHRSGFVVGAVLYAWALLAQNGTWHNLDYPVEVSSISCIYSSPIEDRLLIGGPQSVYYGTDSARNAIYTYESGVWDTLVLLDQPATTILYSSDTLIIGGSFTNVGGSAINNIACFVNGSWEPYGDFNGPIMNIREIDGVLYVVGGFTECEGITSSGVAYRSENGWNSLGTIETISSPSVRDIISYNNEIVITGLIRCIGYKDLLKYDGQNWVPLGGVGILGGISGGASLAVYQTDLIIAGTIDINAGNAGHAIMGWDGSEFYPLGVGPQYLQGTYEFLYRVNALMVDDGILYAGGGFNFVDGIAASRMGAWNGTNWCALGGEIEGEVRALGLFGDSLIVGTWGGQNVNGEDVNNLAAYTLPIQDGPCLGLFIENGTDQEFYTLYPNPTTGKIVLDSGSNHFNILVIVRNTLGQEVSRQAYNQTQPIQLDLMGAPGIYALQVTVNDRTTMVKVVKE